MNTLLHIDSSGPEAFVAISQGNQVLAIKQNDITNMHAQFLQSAIQEMCMEANLPLSAMDAVVVTLGPGSYTGLRVGLATAKGLCFALEKPLIGISTLALLAKAAVRHLTEKGEALDSLKKWQLFSMIDAKRMEVFGGLFNSDLLAIAGEKAFIIDEALLQSLLNKGPLVCIGSGVSKTRLLTQHTSFQDHKLVYLDNRYGIEDMISLASIRLDAKQFEDLAYCHPSYLKEYFLKPLIK